jgi:trans-aconitate methyltransferase
VGCGNAAFTEMLVERCAPAEVQGIDPAEAQIAFARTRLPAARRRPSRSATRRPCPGPTPASTPR